MDRSSVSQSVGFAHRHIHTADRPEQVRELRRPEGFVPRRAQCHVLQELPAVHATKSVLEDVRRQRHLVRVQPSFNAPIAFLSKCSSDKPSQPRRCKPNYYDPGGMTVRARLRRLRRWKRFWIRSLARAHALAAGQSVLRVSRRGALRRRTESPVWAAPLRPRKTRLRSFIWMQHAAVFACDNQSCR